MRTNNNHRVFFELLKAGLWEHNVQLKAFDPIDLVEIYRLAVEQSIAGLITAGINHVVDIKFSRNEVMPFLTEVISLEQRNTAMNSFIARFSEEMQSAGIRALIVKGQGIAQCYERPLWRACGDIDILSKKEDYDVVRNFIVPIAQKVYEEKPHSLHQECEIDNWDVELHGTLRPDLGRKIDRSMDAIQALMFQDNQFREWNNNNVLIKLPSSDNDVIIVFVHILQHFFHGGIGLRQICDWSRLLWKNHSSLDTRLLERRLKKMGIMTEWKTFAALVVEYLGMPIEAMPFYSSDARWKCKADSVLMIMLETGNFGHNRDNSYYNRYPFIIRKLISFWRYVNDGIKMAFIFPLDSSRILTTELARGVVYTLKGK